MGSCRHAKDCERKRAQCERQHALAMEKSISQDVLATLVSIENHIDRRWRKCIIVVDSLSNFLHDANHNLNDEDKQQVPRRFLDKETI
jgi:archaellum biogenesis ATPase FlaH